MSPFIAVLLFGLFVGAGPAWAQSERVVEIATRPGITQRFLVLAPEAPTAAPKAAVILFAGGHGGLQLSPQGRFGWGAGNFLVRTRALFASQGLLVAVIDAPSDRQVQPFLGGFRQRPEHTADVQAVIAWLKQRANVPVWLVGTSRGTQSAAFIATALPPAAGGPDGLVLTSTLMIDPRGRGVTAMPIENIRVPVLVVHHREDGCEYCKYADVPRVMEKLTTAPRKDLITAEGGISRGDACEAMAHHGYNGIEREVVAKIAEWIVR